MADSARGNELFHNLASTDFLKFVFGKAYAQQLNEAIQATGKFCAVTCEIKAIEVCLSQYLSSHN